MTIPTGASLAFTLALVACSAASTDASSSQDPGGQAQDSGSTPSGDGSAPRTGFTRTKYPIVLAHGFIGFHKLVGVVDYFFGVPGDLRSSGGQVFATQVSAINSSVVRGEQLLQQIEQIAASTGAGKVNLIAHSQGGADARYVMAVRPDLLASLTTVATPHLGGEGAETLLAYVDNNAFSKLVLVLFGDAFGAILDLLTGTPEPQDAIAALRTLSKSEAAAFNTKYPAGLPTTPCGEGAPTNGDIQLFSWTGSATHTNSLDISDSLLALLSASYTTDNDGLVDRCGSHFGTVLRDNYVMNHLDEINQVLGLTAVTETSPLEVYRTHANRLKTAGL